MLSSLSVAVFLLMAASGAHSAGQACLCSALPSAGLRVNCSFLNLMALQLSHLPSDTTELHAQDNRLTSVPPGSFDRLVGLEKVSLSGNPFHCDCGIQYLRNWLLKNGAIVCKDPTCASPSSVAQKPISALSDDYFSDCAMASCADGLFNTGMVAMLGLLVLLLLWGLKVAKMSAITLHIVERHSEIENNSLRLKYRRRTHTGLTEVCPL